MTTTPKVSKTTYPEKQLTQDEWFRQYGVASGYTKPTRYYGGNVFNTKVFLGQTRSAGGNLFGKIINFLNPLSWAN
jgi:hypothetical protein